MSIGRFVRYLCNHFLCNMHSLIFPNCIHKARKAKFPLKVRHSIPFTCSTTTSTTHNYQQENCKSFWLLTYLATENIMTGVHSYLCTDGWIHCCPVYYCWGTMQLSTHAHNYTSVSKTSPGATHKIMGITMRRQQSLVREIQLMHTRSMGVKPNDKKTAALLSPVW
jgi:hypothetical protein